MGRINKFKFTLHAIKQFKKRAAALGLPSSFRALRNLIKQMKPERITSTNRFHLFKRSIIYGPCTTYTYTALGWRFIVSNNTILTIERLKPHENYAYMRRKRE